MSVIQWNVNGFYVRYEELKLLQSNFSPSAFLLQETHFKAGQNISFRHYNVFCDNASNIGGTRARGGAAILLKEHLPAQVIPLSPSAFQVVAVRTTLHTPVTLCSVYIAPHISVTRTDLALLVKELPPPYLICGDVNAHSPLWDNCKLASDPRGKEFEHLLQNGSIQLLNDGTATHFSTRHTYSAIDLTLSHPHIAADFAWSVYGDRGGSDHHPLILQNLVEHKTGAPQRWKLAEADWDAFVRNLPAAPATLVWTTDRTPPTTPNAPSAPTAPLAPSDLPALSAPSSPRVTIRPNATLQSVPPKALSHNYSSADNSLPPLIADSAVSNQLPPLTATPTNIDREVHVFENILLTSASHSIPCTKAYHNSATITKKQRGVVPWWNQECATAVRTRRQLYHRFRRYPTTENMIALKKQEAVTRKTLKTARAESFRSYVSEMTSNTSLADVFKKIRCIRGLPSCTIAPLTIKGTTYASPSDIAEQLASHFSSVSSQDNIPLQSRLLKDELEAQPLSFCGGESEPYNVPFTLIELEHALKSTSDTAPGPDRIPYAFLKHLPSTYLSYLLSIYNYIWHTGIIPTAWTHAIVVPIKKPGKCPSSPSSYRPISLTNTLIKLLERMIGKRLTWFLDSSSYLTPVQCGSRKGRSVTDHLVRASSHILDGFVHRLHTVGIFFDITAAYDSCWRHGILKQLHEWGMRGNMAIFLQSFLKTRSFSVRCGDALSGSYGLENGTPQGSVLSCQLFLIAINSITKILPPEVLSCLYIDDLGIFVSAPQISDIEAVLHPFLSALEMWSYQTGFRFSPQKTAMVHFCRKRCTSNPHLTLYGTPLPIVASHKFLGLIFDQKLTWTPHIINLRSRSERALNLLKIVSSYDWGADRATLFLLYRSLVRSLLDYGSTVYASATPSLLKSLDTVHHHALRICLGAFRTTPVASLCIEGNEPPLEYRRNLLLMRYCAGVAADPQHPAAHAIAPLSPRTQILYWRRPLAPKPIPFRLDLLYESLYLNLPPILPTHGLPKQPPWTLSPPDIDTSLVRFPKDTTPLLIYNALLRSVLSDHPPPLWTHFYTDGAKREEGVASAFIGAASTASYQLLPHCTSYTAELVAILSCLEYIADNHLHLTVILTDSLSSLQSLQNTFNTQPLVQMIHDLLHTLTTRRYSVKFVWVPSHVGIPGNAAADKAAGEAASAPRTRLPYNTVIDLKSAISHAVRLDWVRAWTVSPPSKLSRVQPVPSPWTTQLPSRRDEVVAARLRLGHTRLTHSHLFRREPPAECEHCLCPITLDHVLIDCPQFIADRSELPLPHTPAHLLGPSCIRDTLKFLRTVDLFRHI